MPLIPGGRGGKPGGSRGPSGGCGTARGCAGFDLEEDFELVPGVVVLFSGDGVFFRPSFGPGCAASPILLPILSSCFC